MTYVVYWYRNGETNNTTITDYRGACIVAYNEVHHFCCDVAYVTDGETGEILRAYQRG